MLEALLADPPMTWQLALVNQLSMILTALGTVIAGVGVVILNLRTAKVVAAVEETKAIVDETKVIADATHEAANSSYSKLEAKLDALMAENAALKAQIPISLAEARVAKDLAAKIINPHKAFNGVEAGLKQDVASVKDDTIVIRNEVVDTVREEVQSLKAADGELPNGGSGKL